MSLLGRIFTRSHRRSYAGIVRMFEVEYAKEYKNAINNGIEVTPKFVESYFKNHR